ncbi:hypothetical protein ACFQ1Q_01155 [Winogradskyella litorisediminis]|uniref:Uncharacterized protein n=1 Tax=Winogradskyella litorisediminis TaxID=1156618 RepID=A0ABW3N5V4_9FLAO
MKKTNFLCFLAFGLLLFNTCDSDDGPSQDEIDSALFPTSSTVNFEPDVTLDVDAVLNLPAGSDISNLINLGQPAGQSAAEFESVVRLQDVVILGQPTGIAQDDVLLYSFDFDIILDNGDRLTPQQQIDIYDSVVITTENIDDVVGQQNIVVDFRPSDGAPLINFIGLTPSFADQNSDLNFKYDIECWILRNDVLNGPYIIDPKIRIKSLNFSGN